MLLPLSTPLTFSRVEMPALYRQGTSPKSSPTALLRCHNPDILCFLASAVNILRLTPRASAIVQGQLQALVDSHRRNADPGGRYEFLVSLVALLNHPGGSNGDIADLSQLQASLARLKPDLMDGQMQDAAEALVALLDSSFIRGLIGECHVADLCARIHIIIINTLFILQVAARVLDSIPLSLIVSRTFSFHCRQASRRADDYVAHAFEVLLLRP
jgi:hypothetical protein